MKNLLFLLVCGILAAGPARADSYSFKESFSQTYPLSANGALSLENVNGKIEIRTWDRAEIKIEGEKSAKSEEELKLIDLTIDPRPDRVAIRVKLPRRPGSWFGGRNIRAAVRFTITVPADARLDAVKTVNAGIEIEGVRGAVHAGTVNGRIHASGLGSHANLTTVNGSIDAQFAVLPAGSTLAFESVNGGISLALPKDAGLQVRTSVVNGRVNCNLPLVDGQASKKNLRGTIGDGRAELNASTVNGSIRLNGT